VVTSIDYDHPDYFKTPEEYAHSFKRFVDGIRKKGFLAVCGDDAEANKLSVYATEKGLRTMSYGFLPSNTIVLRDGGVVKQQQVFHVLFNGKQFKGTIPFVGKQYVLNSGAAFAVAVMMGIEPKKAIAAMASFPGTARRFEVVKKAKDYIIIDDYAHHPTAIKITLEGVRAMYPKSRIVAVFQPHMFSRTQALLDGFAQAFGAANEVGIMEIYPSARETAGPVNGKTLAAKAKFFHRRVTYLPDMESGKQYVKQRCKENNVIVLMGAGNVNELAE
jgi:UDP-N-acetylmuramate--alanine ligase